MSASLLVPWLHLLVPVIYLVGAVLSRTAPWGAAVRWRAAQVSASLALAAALAVAAGSLIGWLSGASDPGVAAVPPVSLVLVVLVTFLGFVIVAYSRQYLSREPGEAAYIGTLLATLAAVSAVVLTDHMLVLLAAWTAISVGLHRLLLFYPERPRAVLAAHKKFLFSRATELLLLGAVVLLYQHHGTWQISTIVAAYPVAELSVAEQAAAVLLAAAALVKCAQLPVHGWLIQVVEAPTPVSALLHAGVVNLGGYLLILFGPLLMQATAAQWLVLVVAGISTLVAVLVMATRISIKVRLAWSTCAQMGLMLVECALGLFELALLHLTAHACYKAYGFLAAGGAVEQHLSRRLTSTPAPSSRDWLVAGLIGTPLAVGGGLLLAPDGPFSTWLLLGAALMVVVAERGGTTRVRALIRAAALALLVLGLYTVQKLGFGTLVPGAVASAGWLADAWVAGLAMLLAALWLLLRLRPDGLFSHRLAVWLFGGLYLDEWATRTTLRLWPARLPPRAVSPALDIPEPGVPVLHRSEP